MRTYTKKCPYCEETFTTQNLKKYFCSSRCRRDYQNARAREKRAERADTLEEYHMPDVWEENQLPPAITENALLDGWTAQCDMCPDEAVGGPLACQQCPHWRKSVKTRKRIDLLCEMCRSGVSV